ncbi:MAG: NAD(P)H-hydrate dehydratase [Thermoplasmatota archaeon]
MVLPVREFRRLDLNAEEAGVPVRRLMERAGRALADAALEMAAERPGPLLFLCGKGNNGGDGFAAASLLLADGHDAQVVLVEPAANVRDPAAKAWLDRLASDCVGRWPAARPPGPVALVVDCLLGSGLAGPPRAPYDEAIRWVNAQRRRKVPILACDVPSGLGTKTTVHPEATVTFHDMKEGMTESNSGRIHVSDIGIPRRAATHVGLGDLVVGYPAPAPDAHKGQGGVLFVVAGGPYTGAAHYAGMAALRTGCDLVVLWTPADAARIIASWGPDLIVHACNDGGHLTSDGAALVAADLGRASTLLVGPGLGTHPETREAVGALLDAAAKADVPVVVDADGLDGVTPEWLRRQGARTVLTPHAREFTDLGPRSASPDSVRRYAGRHGVTVLRKGAEDVIATGDGAWKRCDRGHPTMTVGGTGDLLAGAVAALLAKGATPFDAACAGAYLVGCAGENAATLRSYGATASDVLEAIPSVLLRMA